MKNFLKNFFKLFFRKKQNLIIEDARVIKLHGIIIRLEAEDMWLTAKKLRGYLTEMIEKKAA